MALQFRAIVPQKFGTKATDAALVYRNVYNEMRDFAGRVNRIVAQYPPQSPTTYVRTGTLGRGWFVKIEQGADIIVYVVNPVTYATYVLGPRQSRVMKSKGWKTLEAVANVEWRKTQLRIADIVSGRR